MRFLLVLGCFLASSCATKISTSALIQEADSVRVTLMRKESEVSGNFFQLRIFHQDLMQVTTQPEAALYKELDSIFYAIKQSADKVIVPRLKYDSTYYEIKSICAGKKKKKLSAKDEETVEQMHSLQKSLPVQQAAQSEKYYEHRNSYDSVVNANNIRRIGLPEYTVLIDKAVTQWQDTLMEIGRLLARQKADLKTRFPSQKGADFFAAYQPVSEFELKFKGFESMMSQLQNSLSRFEEGNKQDFFYFGPLIRPRMEAQATENIIGSMALSMQEFREMDRTFWNGK